MNHKTKLVVGLLVAAAGVAQAQTPISLHIDAPNSDAGVALLSESGWALSIKLNVELPADAAFPTFAVQPDFATRGNWGFIVFADPDGCMNPPAPSWQPQPTPECGVPDPLPADWDWATWIPPASDETYLEFWPDVDMPGVADFSGNESRQLALVDSAGGGGPEFHRWSDGMTLDCTPGIGDSDCVRFGPDTGDEVVDGFGIGADDDIPGLVILAPYGVGQAYAEPDFELAAPLTARNLAGLLTSVSYDLSDLEKNTKPKTRPATVREFSRIWAHMNIPPLLVRNILQYDACVGNITWPDDVADPEVPESCDGDELWRVDGGAIETSPFNYGRADAAAIDLLQGTTFSLRAFVVQGEAPSALADANGDGQVDSADAQLAGYTLLSNEDEIQLLQVSQSICFGGGGSAVLADLDGNGAAAVPIVCPAGPGDVSRPPR